MIIRIKNANRAERTSVSVPFSVFKFAIADLLSKEGFVGNIAKKGKRAKKFIDIALTYNGGRPMVEDVRRVSKPSKRIYLGYKELLHIKKRGASRFIISTPQGLMTEREARRSNTGGEVLFEIW